MYRNEWVVFFSLQSHSEWSTFLTILTILQVLQFLLSLRSSIFTSSKKLNGDKGYSLRVFSALWDFFRKKFSPKGPPSNFLVFSDRMDVEKSQRVPLSVFSALWDFFPFFFIKGSPIHQYFGISKSFCYFWALDMAPTWAVPGLFIHKFLRDAKCFVVSIEIFILASSSFSFHSCV